MVVCVTSHISGYRHTWVIPGKQVCLEDVLNILQIREGCNLDMCLWNGLRQVTSSDVIEENASLVATLRLRGGKGGFGSMLRAIGAQIEKTTNREACRDLSGRRLRDINEEKRLKDFLAKKVEKEKELLELKKKKLAQLKEGPKHIFEDKSYFEQREKREQDIHESLDKGFCAKDDGETSGVKRCNESKPAVKVKKMRLMDDLEESSEEESSDEEASSHLSGEERNNKNQKHKEEAELGRNADSKLDLGTKEEKQQKINKIDLGINL